MKSSKKFRGAKSPRMGKSRRSRATGVWRQVGWALHVNPYPGAVPCHRVVMKDGSLTESFAFGGACVQRAMLESEGVEVGDDFKVDMKRFQWDGIQGEEL